MEAGSNYVGLIECTLPNFVGVDKLRGFHEMYNIQLRILFSMALPPPEDQFKLCTFN